MSGDTKGRRYLTIMLVPDGGQESRAVRVSYVALRLMGGLAAVIALALTLVAGSWWYLAARASRVAVLESRVDSLTADRGRVAALAQQIETIERQYGRIRDLFGAHSPEPPSDVWLPLPATGRRPSAPRTTASSGLPSSWK